jgi:hypothetical protein
MGGFSPLGYDPMDRTLVICSGTIKVGNVLPHEKMFPNGDGIASPECSLRWSVNRDHPHQPSINCLQGHFGVPGDAP